MTGQEASKDLTNQAKRELSLLTVLHAFFALFAVALLLFGLISPGPFTTMIEIQVGKPGQLPPNTIPIVMAALGALTVFNVGAVFCLRAQKLKVFPILASLLNCLSVVGLPLGLTTIFALNKKNVSQLFN